MRQREKRFLNQSFQTARKIYFATLFLAFSLSGISLLWLPQGSESTWLASMARQDWLGPLVYALFGGGLILLYLGPQIVEFVRFSGVDEFSEVPVQRAANSLLTGSLVGAALYGLLTVFGLVFFILRGNWQAFGIFSILGITLFLLNRPRRKEWMAWLDHQPI